MGFLRRFALGALAGAVGVAYGRAVLARNRSLQRPPIRDPHGEPYPIDLFELSDGDVVEYLDVGEGPVLVWVPGADGPKETFRYQIPHFARSYRNVCADLRSRIEPGHDIDRMADDVIELLDALGVDSFVLVGQSLGSAIAIRLATRVPGRVRGLILANPIARVSYDHVGLNRTGLIPLAQGTTRYLPTPVSRLLARTLWTPLGVWIFDASPGGEALIEYALNTGPRTTPGKLSAARVSTLSGFDLREDLWSLEVPALVVKGPRDVYCPVSWALEIADLLPNARYVPIPGTGHCSHISRPGAFNQALESWLEQLGGLERLDGPERLGGLERLDGLDGGDE